LFVFVEHFYAQPNGHITHNTQPIQVEEEEEVFGKKNFFIQIAKVSFSHKSCCETMD
jgi:hypothetical protein